MNAGIELSQNEHFLTVRDGRVAKRITDSSLKMWKNVRDLGRKYILEAQSVEDGRVLIRIAEYVLSEALENSAAALGAPILVKLGFPPIAAHMFVFYYAIISNITPPVALAAYAASSIADANPNRTGFQAMQLGFLAYVVPFAFCYDPGLLMQGNAMQIGWALVSGVGAVFAFAGMWMGYLSGPLNLPARMALCASGILCLTVWPVTTIAGLVLLIAVHILSKRGQKAVA
ncbi:MAG: TRAP transporter large permease subunit [Fretibacterium sp.]|nr:TRAP transporter large permease subunit [Fretibacterium sp.]